MKKTAMLMAIAICAAGCGTKQPVLTSGTDAAGRATDTFTIGKDSKVTLTCIKHGSLLVDWNGRQIQVDPVSFMEPKTDYSTFPSADYIFVTHEHGDHYDTTAIKALTDPDHTAIVTNQRCSDLMGYSDGQPEDFPGEIHVMGNGDTIQLGEMKVEAVPAYNYTEGHTMFHPKGRDNGFILTFPSDYSKDGTFRIYIAGDTEGVPEMAEIKDIDVAFLPCNQPYTMTVEQLAKAAKTIQPAYLFPYHYSTTDLSPLAGLLEGTDIQLLIRQYQ